MGILLTALGLLYCPAVYAGCFVGGKYGARATPVGSGRHYFDYSGKRNRWVENYFLRAASTLYLVKV